MADGIGNTIMSFAKIGVAIAVLLALGGLLVDSFATQTTVTVDSSGNTITQTITNSAAYNVWNQVTTQTQNLVGKWALFIGLMVLVMIFAYFMGVFGGRKE